MAWDVADVESGPVDFPARLLRLPPADPAIPFQARISARPIHSVEPACRALGTESAMSRRIVASLSVVLALAGRGAAQDPGRLPDLPLIPPQPGRAAVVSPDQPAPGDQKTEEKPPEKIAAPKTQAPKTQ